MTSAIGWYGPLIDLSGAASHIGDFVQLLVFVHRSTPVQYKLSRGGEVVRTDIQVGDDTRPFFSVCLWQKQMGSMAVAGDIILLQNVKITSFGGIVEARTIHHSSLRCLIHPYESLLSKGIDDLIGHCQVGFMLKEKLRKVVGWVQRVGSTSPKVKLPNYQNKQLARNWNVPGERKSWNCLSLLEVSCLSNSCKAVFYASVGEIFLPLNDRALGELEKENMFIRRRLSLTGDTNLVEDLICTGCQLCGSPLDLEHGSLLDQNSVPLYCGKSTNRLHAVSLIYRPFMLYVWDKLEYIPLLVTNKAAELLFGNIRAERVYSSYSTQKQDRNPQSGNAHLENNFDARPSKDPKAVMEGIAGSCSLDADKSLKLKEKHKCSKGINFHMIWLILLKMLLQQEKNSPLKFEVNVDPGLDKENGRFEMVSISMPCFKTKLFSD